LHVKCLDRRPGQDVGLAVERGDQAVDPERFDFALSMIKLHGFGGPSRFWDYNLESFTLMAGLIPVTSRIRLIATCAVLTMPPPITARMAVTIDSISHGRPQGRTAPGRRHPARTQPGSALMTIAPSNTCAWLSWTMYASAMRICSGFVGKIAERY